ncbi:hypothetical protein K402DRAFT_328148 [Aulographum hederae CBS 113979]|uniref:DUF8035 domain-containing protein n=1 Tax=Aulographum hederae CBS 113979 TaxID=1176131 RepID=A0A6G1H6L3_9PEZI|nr:hypothetical protein K402DRAFT_328148 [Aulographum hederae CBS 113979]
MSLVKRPASTPPSAAPSRKAEDEWGIEAEADYYNRKALERAYIGEAHEGATKDWGLVDIPPGTNRVNMHGIGGGRQEVTWQRYNGARRATFYADEKEFSTDYGAIAKVETPPPPPPPAPAPPPPSAPPAKKSDMWTEVTKDLVIKEAIEAMGYGYEETDDFFYVMEYLRYEDVLQLVEISDDIRRERRRRIREIEWERQELDSRKSKYDETVIEREVIYDSRRGRYA